jgi:hypothetical protein
LSTVCRAAVIAYLITEIDRDYRQGTWPRAHVTVEETNSPSWAVEVMTLSDATDYRTWNLGLIEERWASVRDAIRKAASRIDLGGMHRAPTRGRPTGPPAPDAS